jgi:hypothetical protein
VRSPSCTRHRQRAGTPRAAAHAVYDTPRVPCRVVLRVVQIGRHTPDHSKAVADTGCLATLVSLESDAASSEDLKTKCRRWGLLDL